MALATLGPFLLRTSPSSSSLALLNSIVTPSASWSCSQLHIDVLTTQRPFSFSARTEKPHLTPLLFPFLRLHAATAVYSSLR